MGFCLHISLPDSAIQTRATQRNRSNFMSGAGKDGGAFPACGGGCYYVVYEQNPLWSQETMQVEGPFEVLPALPTRKIGLRPSCTVAGQIT